MPQPFSKRAMTPRRRGKTTASHSRKSVRDDQLARRKQRLLSDPALLARFREAVGKTTAGSATPGRKAEVQGGPPLSADAPRSQPGLGATVEGKASRTEPPSAWRGGAAPDAASLDTAAAPPQAASSRPVPARGPAWPTASPPASAAIPSPTPDDAVAELRAEVERWRAELQALTDRVGDDARRNQAQLENAYNHD